MGATNLLRPVLGLLLVINFVTAMKWEFEFGKEISYEQPIYEKEGEIGLFSYHNSYTFHVPAGMEVSHVHVTVWSVTPPKVDYHETAHTVSINYAWSQITASSFKIKAIGYRRFH